MTSHHKTYLKAPSLPAMGLGALWPSAGWQGKLGFPTFSFIWRDYRIGADLLRELQWLAGADDKATTDRLLLLAPHVTGFRLTLAMLMHPDWPLPIWQALQLRNRLIRSGDVRVAYPSDLIAQATAWRVHDKGIELGVHAQLLQGDDCSWESITTFYYRGRFAPPLTHGPLEGAALLSPTIDPALPPVAHWTVDGDRRLRFARLTGDGNPLHLLDAYARRTGFAAASAHPQRIAAQCLGHLTKTSAPRQLDLWLKGPVYYNRAVTLRQTHSPEGEEFALWVDGDERAAMVGRLS
ncbi:acyl dehydratase [Rhodopseudomonas palustris]|uniref:Acyl dehydratase n=1 Tax=Rhodopseudomonas palustris TaxID=1076 RepID=A0A418V0M0_RHOPL|nr:acyl dehydratase [Rhodopseudomonas palustris]RJF69252.1 acyl dehydratase [Rhodopseudomonas palustris]